MNDPRWLDIPTDKICPTCPDHPVLKIAGTDVANHYVCPVCFTDWGIVSKWDQANEQQKEACSL